MEAKDDDMAVDARHEEREFSAAKLRRDLQINDADLDGNMTEQASLYAYYSSLYAKAQYEADHAKTMLEVTHAKKYAAIRNAKLGRAVKFSEASLEAEVLRSEDYILAAQQVNKTKLRATLLKEGLEAFKQRRDMLVQKGVSRREEMKGELFLKSRDETPSQRAKRLMEERGK